MELNFKPIQVPGKGWNVKATDEHGLSLYLTTGGPYTLAQAEMAADSLRRDVRNHGAKHVAGGMLIGLI
tara:strand:+ start:175 stop:381 length:207 start_codon:yes stop_codon:yes gene_type:complete